MEGVWGSVVTCAVMWPIFNALPGYDHGHMEDVDDTFYMMRDNVALVWLSVVYFVSNLLLNWAGMVLTQQTSSVVRSIFEAVRTAAIWLVNLGIFYVFAPNSQYGEQWTTFSWV